MTQRFPFTKSSIAKLDARPTRYLAYDTHSPLAVVVHPTGKKVFAVRRSYRGTVIKLTIGESNLIPLEVARKKAHEIVTRILTGEHPSKSRVTVKALFDAWLERHCAAYRRPNYCQESARLFRSHLGSWANRRAQTITLSDVQALHAKVGKGSGPYEANRVKALLSTVFQRGGQ